jgi:hypothetical protein
METERKGIWNNSVWKMFSLVKKLQLWVARKFSFVIVGIGSTEVGVARVSKFSDNTLIHVFHSSWPGASFTHPSLALLVQEYNSAAPSIQLIFFWVLVLIQKPISTELWNDQDRILETLKVQTITKRINRRLFIWRLKEKGFGTTVCGKCFRWWRSCNCIGISLSGKKIQICYRWHWINWGRCCPSFEVPWLYFDSCVSLIMARGEFHSSFWLN